MHILLVSLLALHVGCWLYFCGFSLSHFRTFDHTLTRTELMK
jgi:hypothetical protein